MNIEEYGCLSRQNGSPKRRGRFWAPTALMRNTEGVSSKLAPQKRSSHGCDFNDHIPDVKIAIRTLFYNPFRLRTQPYSSLIIFLASYGLVLARLFFWGMSYTADPIIPILSLQLAALRDAFLQPILPA